MASDRAQFRQASEKWNTLSREKSFSVPAELGSTVIVTPYDHSMVSPLESFDRFEKQASRLAQFIFEQSGVEPIMAPNASRSDIESIYQDPSISTIYFIGRGTLSSIGSLDGPITWKDISESSDHLKTGRTYQLFCGWQPNTLNVPLGMFGMDDHRKTYAPSGRYIRSRKDPVKLSIGLASAVDTETISYDALKARFPQMKQYTGRSHLSLKADRVEHHLRSGSLAEVALRHLRTKLLS